MAMAKSNHLALWVALSRYENEMSKKYTSRETTSMLWCCAHFVLWKINSWI